MFTGKLDAVDEKVVSLLSHRAYFSKITTTVRTDQTKYNNQQVDKMAVVSPMQQKRFCLWQS